MSSRTKGFFEKNNSKPPYWKHNYNNNRPLSGSSNNAVSSKPPLPASFETRKKLKEFVYTGPTQERASMITSGGRSVARSSIEKTTSASSMAASKVEVRPISLPHANTFPSTPSERLTLDELIGVVDKSNNKEIVDNSPDEVLGWNPNSSYQATTPGRKRKRAQSSSPTCPTSEIVEEPRHTAVHMTPMVDPVTELWNRYGGEQRDGAVNLPDISFALQATPRPIETPVKSAGLRRWASAGNEWPSRSKKQRLNASKVWEDKSKLATMLDKMQDSMARSNFEKRSTKDDPSSSSPLPDIGSRYMSVQDATKTRAPLALQSPNHVPRAKPVPQAKATTKLPPFTSHKGSLEARRVQQAQQHSNSIPTTGEVKVPGPPKQTSSPRPRRPVIVEEDFIDDTTDLFDATDLDDLETTIPVKRSPRALAKVTSSRTTASLQQQVGPIAVNSADLVAFAQEFDDTNDDDDEFGLIDLDEQGLLEAEVTATQAYAKPRSHKQNLKNSTETGIVSSPSSTTTSSSQPWQDRYCRFRVQKVYECDQQTGPEKILLAEHTTSKRAATITLRGSWLDTAVGSDHIVHVAFPHLLANDHSTKTPSQLFIDDQDSSPLLIVHPDHMLSATSVAESFDCLRKAVLSDRVKTISDANKWTVYGKILHEVFQQALVANKWTSAYLNDLVIATVQAHLEGLWSIGMRDDVLAIEEIQTKMRELAAWSAVFVRTIPSLDAKVRGSRDESLRVAISGLIAVEEHVWSPMFGLKGNVDATVQVNQAGKTTKLILAPFEVKTGKAKHSSSHYAQTALYTLLMSDRYDVAIRTGILYYLESSEVSTLSPSVREIRDLMQQRNRLASALHNARSAPPVVGSQFQTADSNLPSLLKSAFKCGTCYTQQSCFTFHALCEGGTAESAGMVDDGKKDHSTVWLEAVGHLVAAGKKNDASAARERILKSWFAKWERLLTLEELESSQALKELWTMSSEKREAAGRCFGKLRIRIDHLESSATQSAIDGIQSSGGKINKFLYTFERDLGDGRPLNKGSQLVPGEAIVVSSEQGQWALAKGYVVSIRPDSIVVGVARRLGDARHRLQGFDPDNRQSFKGIMKVDKQISRAQDHTTLYRIDKDEFANGLSMIRNNLVMMMSSHPCHTRLRDLIIFDSVPTFERVDKLRPLPPTQLEQMNEDQQAAVAKVLSAQDYALILGMPGTGKTTTIAHIIRALIAEGKSILLTSYTHTAVDNILLKIRDIGPSGSILRLGNSTKIRQEVKEFCHTTTEPFTSFEQIDERYVRTQIVATTCLGISNALFSQRYFDVCIVDEASQITLPVSLGPLLYARKFVLVGDHYQLSPLVQNRDALEGGLDMSLFRTLSERRPEAVATLGKQYRMCQEIMSISNALVYDERLRCGNDTVAGRTIQYIEPSGLDRLHTSAACQATHQCWLETLTDPQKKVIFVNTDNVGPEARESLVNAGKKITNRLEAVITAQIVLALQALGLPSSDIGVIALYRTQIALIRQLFDAASMASEVELDSADRFQGRDKECVIISMVRSNEAGMVGELIKDWRRLNVAFTRARSKLIVIGSRNTLRNNDLMSRFLQLIDQNQQSFDLPVDAETSHGSAFQFVSQATSAIEQRLSPVKKQSRSPIASPKRSILQESHSGGNKGLSSPSRHSKLVSPHRVVKASQQKEVKLPAKIINGRVGSMSQKSQKMKEQIAFEIFEELAAEDWDI